MTEQLELGAAPDHEIGTDPLKPLRAAYPNSRVLLLIDTRPGLEARLVAIVDSGSPWYQLLPEAQVVMIRASDRKDPPT